jgi:hypothetical protein
MMFNAGDVPLEEVPSSMILSAGEVPVYVIVTGGESFVPTSGASSSPGSAVPGSLRPRIAAINEARTRKFAVVIGGTPVNTFPRR